MSTSKPTTHVATVLALCAVLAGGCHDPTATRLAPREKQLLIMLDLDPELDVQPLFATTFDLRAPEDLVAELWSNDSLVSTAVPEGLYECRLRFNGIQTGITGQHNYCRVFYYRPSYGSTYKLVVHSSGRPTATAETTVPGDFQVVGGTIEGDPPGTEKLDVTWTRSEPSYRYVVFVRDRSYGPLGIYSVHQNSLPGLSPGWTLTTTDTTVSTRRPRDQVWDGMDGDWVVAVYAVDRALYDFMTSGGTDGLFPVPPISNMVNAHGVFGSWVRRYIPVDSFPLP